MGDDGTALRSILLAVDASPESREAVDFGLKLAAQQGSEVIVAHVTPAVEGDAPAGSGGSAGATAAGTVLDEVTRAAEHAGVRCRAELLRGNTVDEIVACADSNDADLVVVGSRVRDEPTTISKSVSRGILEESHRPVLVVPSHNMRAQAAARAGGLPSIGRPR